MDTPIGTQTFVWDLQQTSSGWTGVMDAQTGRSELQGLKVDGQAVAFETRVNSPMGSIDLTFQGAVTGDVISGMCKTSFGNAQFEGRRA